MVTSLVVGQLLVGTGALFVLVKSAELAVSRALALATHYLFSRRESRRSQ